MATLHRNRSVVSEVRTIAKNGEIVWVRTYAKPVWDGPPTKPMGIYGAVQDITAAKRADEVLGASEARMKRAQAIAHISQLGTELAEQDPVGVGGSFSHLWRRPQHTDVADECAPTYVVEEYRPPPGSGDGPHAGRRSRWIRRGISNPARQR